MARYNADGSLDASFGGGGKTSLEFSNAWVRRWSGAGQADGKIVAVSWGVDSASGFDHLQVARLNADGSVDTGFSGDGKVTTTFFGSQNQGYAVTVQGDGKIIAAGAAYDVSTFLGHFALARYEAGGTAPGATLASLTVNPSSVVGGGAATGTLTLSAAAPSGGAVVTLSDDSAAATTPPNATILAGATSVNFSIATSVVSASTPVGITGLYGGVSRSATLTVTASAPAAPALVAPANAASVAQPVAFDWSDVAGAADYEIQVDNSSTIAAPYTANQVVTTSQVSIGALPTQQLWWRVRARNAAGVFGPFSAARRFTPQSSAAASLASVSVNPASVVGGNAATGNVTLTSAAPAGGATVSLSSNAAAASVPANVTVPAGATAANFSVATSSVTTATAATVSALYAGVTRSASLTVNPAGANVTLTVTATGRSGERITSAPAGINVTVGGNQSAGFAANTSVTLSVASGRQAIWSGACSSGGNKTTTCTFTITANAAVTGNVQ